MRKTAIILGIIAAVSCAPLTYTIEVQEKGPSTSGVNIDGKTVSLAFVQSSPADSSSMAAVADGLAIGLEECFFGGQTAIDLFSLKAVDGAQYNAKDTLVNLVVDTFSDIVFVFDSRKYSFSPEGDTLQTVYPLYVYDSMDKQDAVRKYTVRSAYSNDLEDLSYVGQQLAVNFQPTWSNASYTMYYYDSSSSWVDAATYAADEKWGEALQAFLKLVDTQNLTKRACAEYDIALCCYMLGDYELAKSWLDRCDADDELPNSPSLRKRIQQKRGK